MLAEDEIATALQEEGSLILVSPVNLPSIWSYLQEKLKENIIADLITSGEISAESINSLLNRVGDLEPNLVSSIDFSFVSELPDEYREALTTTLKKSITKHPFISQELKEYIATLISPTPTYNLSFNQAKLKEPHDKIYTILRGLISSKSINHPIIDSFKAMFLDPGKTDQEKLLELQKNVFNHCYSVDKDLDFSVITGILNSLGIGTPATKTNRPKKRTIAKDYSILFNILFNKSNNTKVDELTTGDLVGLWVIVRTLLCESSDSDSRRCKGFFYEWDHHNLQQDQSQDLKTKVIVNLKQSILVALVNRLEELNARQLKYVELKVLLEQLGALTLDRRLTLLRAFPKEISRIISGFISIDPNKIVDSIYNIQVGNSDEDRGPKLEKMIQIARAEGTVEKLSSQSLKKIIITMRQPLHNWHLKRDDSWHYRGFQKEWLDAIDKISKQSTKLDDRDVLNLIELTCEIIHGEIPFELINRLNKDIISEITNLKWLSKLRNHVSEQIKVTAKTAVKEIISEVTDLKLLLKPRNHLGEQIKATAEATVTEIIEHAALTAATKTTLSQTSKEDINLLPVSDINILKDIDEKITWFISNEIGADDDNNIIDIIESFPGPLPENIALAILQLDDIEYILTRYNLTTDCFKKIFHNIDIETIKTKLTPEVLLRMSPKNIIASIPLLSDQNLKEFIVKLLESEIDTVATGAAFPYRYNDSYHKNFKRRSLILEIANIPEMIEKLAKLAEADSDFATTHKTFNQEKDQSGLDRAIREILEKTRDATTKLKPRFLAETEDELTREHEGLKRCIAEIDTLIESVGEDELRAKLRVDLDTELQKVGEHTSLDDLKAAVSRYKESIKERILGVIQECTEWIIRYNATLKDKGRTVRDWGFDTSLRNDARRRAYNNGHSDYAADQLYTSVGQNIQDYKRTVQDVKGTLKHIDTLIQSHLEAGHEDLPKAQQLLQTAKREMRNYFNSKEVKTTYSRFERQAELTELLRLFGALPTEVKKAKKATTRLRAGEAAAAPQCGCLQSIRNALRSLRGGGAGPSGPR